MSGVVITIVPVAENKQQHCFFNGHDCLAFKVFKNIHYKFKQMYLISNEYIHVCVRKA